MAGVIDTVSSSLGSSPGIGAAQQSAPALDPAAATAAKAVPIRNPQIIQDPTAGFITEYVNTSNGQVIAQVPSAITVAYLRQGLTAEGRPKSNPTSVTKTA